MGLREDLDQAISCPLSNFTANSQKVVNSTNSDRA